MQGKERDAITEHSVLLEKESLLRRSRNSSQEAGSKSSSTAAPTDPTNSRMLLAEFFGTFLLLIVGLGANAQYTLAPKHQLGSYQAVDWAWGFAVLIGITIAGPISGAHLNPAVTLALLVFGQPSSNGSRKRQPIKLALAYMGVQTLAGFLASAVIMTVYIDGIRYFDGGVRQITGDQGTAGIFATYPQHFVSAWSGLKDQVVGTAVLVAVIFACQDSSRYSLARGSEAFVIAITLVSLGMSFAFNCGYPLNPARDFGPRLFTWIAGYGPGVFQQDPAGWWWIPIVGPFLGGLCGGGFYRIFIG